LNPKKLMIIISGMSAIPASMISKCLRCGHQWTRRTAKRPVQCPNCKQPRWDVPVGVKKRGRPRRKAAEAVRDKEKA
jgi:hypothetical protein